MDWFLRDNGLRHERVKCACRLRGPENAECMQSKLLFKYLLLKKRKKFFWHTSFLNVSVYLNENVLVHVIRNQDSCPRFYLSISEIAQQRQISHIFWFNLTRKSGRAFNSGVKTDVCISLDLFGFKTKHTEYYIKKLS